MSEKEFFNLLGGVLDNYDGAEAKSDSSKSKGDMTPSDYYYMFAKKDPKRGMHFGEFFEGWRS
jgi:hypothetical protein